MDCWGTRYDGLGIRNQVTRSYRARSVTADSKSNYDVCDLPDYRAHLRFVPFSSSVDVPVSFALGTLSLMFPFSLLSVPGRTFGVICCIGLTRRQSTGSINLFDKDGNYKLRDQMTPEEQKAFDAEMIRLTEKLKETDFD